MDVSKLMVIWPNNIDSTRTIKKGRRIPKASACECPPTTPILPARLGAVVYAICNPLPLSTSPSFSTAPREGLVAGGPTVSCGLIDLIGQSRHVGWTESLTSAPPCSAVQRAHRVVVDVAQWHTCHPAPFLFRYE